MVSAHGAVAGDEYVDANTGRVLKFDHRRRKFTEATDKKQTLPPAVAGYRAAVQKTVDSYLSGSFKAGKAVATVYGGDSGVLTICISAKNVNLSNFWYDASPNHRSAIGCPSSINRCWCCWWFNRTGSWRSVYTLNVSKTGASELKGNVKVQVCSIRLHPSTTMHMLIVHYSL